jgi:hypothetical protein
MNTKITTLSTTIAIVMGSTSFTSSAGLVSSTTLSFTLGTQQVVSCYYGTIPPCNQTRYNNTDIVGSYFAIDHNFNGVEPTEKVPIGSFNGIHIGSTQAASGSHTGVIDGSENPNIDLPWEYFGSTGMHQTTSPITDLTGTGSTRTLDFSGWGWNWNGIDVPITDMGTIITCDTAACSDTSNYTLDAAFHMNGAGFTTAPYYLHLEGRISSVPIPAAAWFFASGLIGLVCVARRKKQS